MSDKEVIATYRRTMEIRIPQAEATIVEAENNTELSPTFRANWIVELRKQIATFEQELINYDIMMESICRTA